MVINEKIQYEDPLLSLRIFQLRRRHNIRNHWHYHKEIELLLVLEGWLEVNVEEETYELQANDLLLIGSNELHRDRTSRDSGLRYIVLQFDPDRHVSEQPLPYLNSFSLTYSPLSKLNTIFNESRQARQQVHQAMLDIYEEVNHKSSGYELAVNILVKQIVLTLIRHDRHGVLQTERNPDLLRLKPVLDWIESNTADRIDVQRACEMVNMSYYYFVKYFRKIMGMTFTDYVHYRKIKKAERMLLTEDVSIATVGEQIGMPNMAHFYKVFKKINDCSPNEFRKVMQRWTN